MVFPRQAIEREAMEQAGRLLGSEVVTATAAARGYTNNARWIVGLADGRSAFVKRAVDGPTREWLRREQRAYAHLDGPFVPHAPQVREIRRVQLEIALPWAAAALGLPTPARHNQRP